MIIQLKYFHYSLNIVAILAHDRELFSAWMCPIYFKIYRMKLNEIDFPWELLSFIFDI